METLPLVLALGLAGALGAVARYGVVEWVAARWLSAFPLATFLINISGAFALGLVLTVGAPAHAPNAPDSWRVVLGTGFLGGYTTFSTLSFETQALAQRGHNGYAWLNALGSLVAGIVAAALGIALGSLLR